MTWPGYMYVIHVLWTLCDMLYNIIMDFLLVQQYAHSCQRGWIKITIYTTDLHRLSIWLRSALHVDSFLPLFCLKDSMVLPHWINDNNNWRRSGSGSAFFVWGREFYSHNLKLYCVWAWIFSNIIWVIFYIPIASL